MILYGFHVILHGFHMSLHDFHVIWYGLYVIWYGFMWFYKVFIWFDMAFICLYMDFIIILIISIMIIIILEVGAMFCKCPHVSPHHHDFPEFPDSNVCLNTITNVAFVWLQMWRQSDSKYGVSITPHLAELWWMLFSRFLRKLKISRIH